MIRILALAFLLSPAAAFAQPADGARGSVPPGSAADGSRPADGAIKGGSILPGERGGVPENAPSPERRAANCNELSGTLRDDCVRREQDAGVGATKPDPTKSAAPSAPPPQNPR
ncbi:MAG TPA: hypothetical protein VEB41_06465 [Burkholderiales bacterium]|nr:hypothetical protein [Burkholderiales bacterium]